MTQEVGLAVEQRAEQHSSVLPPKRIVSMAQHLDGMLVVHKPVGMISKDVSRWLVRRFGRLKIGHVGTLDPGASGVLAILLGRATKLQDFLLELPKSYEFDVAFGSETDTLDRDGTVVREAPWDHLTAAAVEEATRSFLGPIEQLPPLYSAVKFKGRPLYDYARSGVSEENVPPLDELKRHVNISSFVMHSYENGMATFSVTCSKGTYVRVLAKDLAEKLGTCGTLARLVRTRAAGFDLTQAHSLEQIEQCAGEFDKLVLPMSQIDLGLSRWQAQRKSDVQRLRSGQPLVLDIEDYFAGLSLSEGVEPDLTAWSRQLVLLTETGMALGIGTVRRNEVGRVVLTMKRGL